MLCGLENPKIIFKWMIWGYHRGNLHMDLDSLVIQWFKFVPLVPYFFDGLWDAFHHICFCWLVHLFVLMICPMLFCYFIITVKILNTLSIGILLSMFIQVWAFKVLYISVPIWWRHGGRICPWTMLGRICPWMKWDEVGSGANVTLVQGRMWPVLLRGRRNSFRASKGFFPP